MTRRGGTLPVPSATTAVAAVAIALIAGIALLNTARVGTTVPPGVYLPGASTGAAPLAPDPGPTGASGPASPAGTPGPEAARPPSSVTPTGSATTRSPSTMPQTGGTYRSSGSDTQVSTVAPNYPVDVSSDEQPTSDGTSSGTSSSTTGSATVVDH